MSDLNQPGAPGLPIASVERETGLSKDTLRVWERRYGFPTPTRDPHGERLYTPAQVRQLARIKRLMDRGYRPGKLLAMDDAALAALDIPLETAVTPEQAHIENWLERVKAHDIDGLQRLFHSDVAKRGLSAFVQDVVAPLITRVGEAWSRNELGIFEEHLFSQHLEKLFRLTLANLVPQAGRPRVLLTTLSGEEHTLGLLMVEALLTVEGAYPVLLGPQTPIDEIVRAARLKAVDVVCLSFSSAYPGTLAAQGLRDLRRVLPPQHDLWAGGHGVLPLRKPIEGVCLLPGFADLHACLAAWKTRNGAKVVE